MRIIAPIAKVRISDNEFISGDGLLRFVSVELGEDARASSCRFEVADPEMAIAGKYFNISFKEGGIKVPSDLLSAPPAQQPQTILTSSAPSSIMTAPPGKPMELGAWQSEDTAWNERVLIAECLRQGVTSPRKVAYILGTAYHETGAFTIPLEWASGEDYEFWADLGNNSPGDGPRYKGRGYTQITGKVNYQRYQDLLGIPLVAQPELAEQPGISAFIAVHGINTNNLTKNAAAHRVYLNDGNFWPMTRIVNAYPPDVTDMIVGYCEDYLQRLTGGDLAQHLNQTAPTPPAAPTLADDAKNQSKPKTATPSAQNPAPAKPEEVSHKGTEIIIELGYEISRLISFHFIHTGTSTSGRSPGSTVFEGQSVRWMMSRRTKNATYKDITLRQLATLVCKNYGLTLKMEGDGPTYKFLDQTGISDYRLLLREAKAIGYRITDDGAILKISPWRPEFTGFVITPEILDKISFTDRAKAEMQGVPSTATPTSSPDSRSGEQKTTIDRKTGKIKQIKGEDSTGTGLGLFASVTGTAIATMHGTVSQTPRRGDDAHTPHHGTDSHLFDQIELPLRKGQFIAAQNAMTLAGKKIILDPGHGITDTDFDPGAVAYGTTEAIENLHQANIVASHLRQLGAEVKVLDEPLSLAETGRRAEGYDIFVSLHQNAFDKNSQGHEVFYYLNAPNKDAELAQAINDELDAVFPDSEIPNRGVKTANFSVLRNSPASVPSVLVESLFMDAPGMSRANVEKAATAVARGIENFFTGNATNSVTESPVNLIFDESETQLPTQEIGAIDLADGTASAIAIKDEARRVKGYESTASFKTTPEALALAAGSVIGIADSCFQTDAAKEAFAREWRVGRVKHVFQLGSARTEIEIYTPQQAKPPAPVPTQGAVSFASAGGVQMGQFTSTSSVGYIWPMKGYFTSPYGPRNGGWHAGIDIANGSGNVPILAAADGTVDYATYEWNGGYGNMVDLKHPDGSLTRYAHMQELKVQQGQAVRKGQVIGTEGNTGHSFGDHLHFEIRPNGNAYGRGAAVDPVPLLPGPAPNYNDYIDR